MYSIVYSRLDDVLVSWKLKFSSPVLTANFVKMFQNSRDMFDSVYSMLIARNLPHLPDGVDPSDPHVKRIVAKIRNEAGSLIGTEALQDAENKLKVT